MDKLNDVQKQAALAENNVVLVIAGAGSGKTTVLTKRIEHLILHKHVEPSSILAITFTNKAVNEMKTRLISSLGPYGAQIEVKTFHAFSMKVIRENIDYLPHHNKNFVIIDDSDKKKIIKDILKRLGLSEVYKTPNVMWEINKAKTFNYTHTSAKNAIDFELIDVYNEYERYLNSNNAMDFDDLLIYCYELLQIKEVALKYQKKLNYIHVDEYQDTSVVQALILKLIKDIDTKLFIVGDVDQAIYSWRGANVENIMNIEKEFDDVAVIKLEQNYRSTKNIITAANNLIKNNDIRYDKSLWTDNIAGQKVLCHRFSGAQEEADFIEKEVKYLLEVGKSHSDIAILYRYNYQSKKIEEALMRSNISYVIYGGIRFYERMEIRDMIAYLRLILDNKDNISFSRIVNVPKRSVGDVTLAKIRGISIAENISYFEASEIIATKQISKFNDIIKRYRNLDQDNFVEMFDSLLEDIGYENYLLATEEQAKVDERLDNLREFKFAINDALKSGSDLNSYLNEILLFAEKENDEANSVVLSTVHGVKGLEFDNVFVIGMNEGKFPKHYDAIDFEMLQEDRRVAYVAITRACKKLVITNISYDYTGQYLEDSRFIKEMGLEETIIKKEGFIF